MHDPAERDATAIRQSFSAEVTDLYGATEVICSRTPSQIQLIKQIYHSKFGALLENDIQGRTSGDHMKVHFPDDNFSMPSILVAIFW